MTPKQRAFAAQYALDHNGAAAAVRAGYARKTAKQIACELLTKPDVAGLVGEYEQAAAERLEVTRERAIAEIKAAVELAKQKGDTMAMIAGWREIGKMCGYYAPERKKVEVSLNNEALQAKFACMSDAELLKIVEQDEL